MKILALDSAETTAAVALTDTTRLLGQSSVLAGQNHSAILLPMIDQLLQSCHLTYDDIDLFACSSGPGSFTGVRIGVATVKGLAFGREKRCIGVSATEALAYSLVSLDGILCPVMDARRSQLYNALYRAKDGRLERLTPDRLIPAASLAAELATYREPIYACGGGYDILHAACPSLPHLQRTPALLQRQNAYGVALAALASLEAGGEDLSLSDSRLAPLYLRPSQAERMKNGEA